MHALRSTAPVWAPVLDAPDAVVCHQVHKLLRRVARASIGDERSIRSFRATDLPHDAWLQWPVRGGRTNRKFWLRLP